MERIWCSLVQLSFVKLRRCQEPPKIFRVSQNCRVKVGYGLIPPRSKRDIIFCRFEPKVTMSKRNIEGDVLSNRLAVGQAKSQRLLAAMLGPNLKSENADEKLQRQQEREELEDESFGPEQCVLTHS